MKDTDLMQLALGLTPPWLVMSSTFSVEEKRLDIRLLATTRGLGLALK